MTDHSENIRGASATNSGGHSSRKIDENEKYALPVQKRLAVIAESVESPLLRKGYSDLHLRDVGRRRREAKHPAGKI